MLPVYICSNDPSDIVIFESAVSDYIQNNSVLDIRIFCSTTNPDQLFASAKTHMIQSLYFLDYNSENIILAREIRRYDPRAFIVVSYDRQVPVEKVLKSRIEAIGIVNKNDGNCAEQLYGIIEEAYKLNENIAAQHHGQLCLQLHGNDENYVIPQPDIYMITASNETHCVNIYTESDIFPMRYTLDTIRKDLGETFIRCHRKYIVNLQHVIKIDKMKCTIELDDRQIVPCSRRAIESIQILLTVKEFYINISE